MASSKEDSVLLAGFLEKSPPLNKTTSGLKGFKKRWFVLRGDSTFLSYYESSDTRYKPKGSIDMEEVLAIESNQKWTGPNKDKHPWVFTIEIRGGRTFYLSAPSKESMNNWVEKLVGTFKYYLLNNNEESGDAPGNFENGVVSVNMSLICSGKHTSSIVCQEATTALEGIELCLKKAEKQPETSHLYCLVLVNSKTDHVRRLNNHEVLLSVLRCDIGSSLFIVHQAEAHYILKLIKLEEQKERLEKGEFKTAYDVVYLGSAPVMGQEDNKKPPTTAMIVQAYDTLKKSPRAQSTDLRMSVGPNGVQVLTPTGNPRRPYAIVMEQSLHTIANCLDVDKAFIYVSAPAPGVKARDFKCFAFKCSDKRTAGEIRELVTLNCNQVFAQIHEAAKLNQQPIGLVLRNAAQGIDVKDMKPPAPSEPTPPPRRDTIEFQQFDGQDLTSLLRQAEMPAGSSSLRDIEKFLDGEFPDEDEDDERSAE